MPLSYVSIIFLILENSWVSYLFCFLGWVGGLSSLKIFLNKKFRYARSRMGMRGRKSR